MGDVKRYTESCMEGGGVCPSRDGELVTFLDYEAALVREAALREELANVKRSRADELENYNDMISDLTAAEQRNATLHGLLERWYEANCNGLVHVEDGAYRIVLDTNEVLYYPTESGAGE